MQTKKKKIIVTLTLVIVCLALLISASFAWLSLSRTPEVTGIETNVGANGSLEIALLTGQTYMHPDEIRTAIGSSMEEQEVTISNISWGNVIDLSDESYGLGKISLLPARLDVMAIGDRDSVSNNLLKVPLYGEDGRFSGFNNGMVTGTYQETGFFYDSELVQHGVRGIGTITNVTAQQVALTEAKTSVVSYQSAAISAMESVWRANGAGMFNIFYRLYVQNAQTFTHEDIAVLRDTATRMLGVLDYVDSALRQGVIGYAASIIDNEAEFKSLRNTVSNASIPLSVLTRGLPDGIIGSFDDSISKLDQDKAAVRAAISYCDGLEGVTPNSADITRILVECGLLEPSLVYFGEAQLPDMSGTLTADNKLKLFAGRDENGVMDGIAGYIGSYSVFFTYKEGVSVEVQGEMLSGKAALTLVSEQIGKLTAAGISTTGQVLLEDMYGYAIDMAFRCNATSDLLLQTVPSLRVDENTQFLQEQGGGSYMRFQTEYLKLEQMLPLMDAIRIGFLNNQNDLVAIAKLNTSNYEETEEGVAAPLYLYNYSVAADGSISMGERLKDDAAITELPDSEPVVMTMVVWLDGDHVENSYVAVNAQSMTGVLNLQFASSAELDPAYKDDPDATQPEGAQPTVPTEPEETTPTEPTDHSGYYLGIENGQTFFYTVLEDGSRDYVLPFIGTVDAENNTIVVESITEYPEQGIFIPALATYNDVQYAVSIDPSAPFAELTADEVHISFVPVEDSKVAVTGTSLSDLFDAKDNDRSLYRSLDLRGLNMTLSQKSYLTDLIARANALNALNQTEYAVDAALITAAETVLTGYETITLNTATKVVAEETIVALESAVLAAEKAKAEKEASDAAAAVDKNTADMTSEQRTLLTTAVTNAKTIEGYETSADLDQLRAATEAVEALLAKTAGVTIKNAEDALAALNEQLTANGLKEVTAYNTIQHNLPIGSEIYEVGYATDISTTLLRPTQNTGSAEITAVVLTKNGMVFKAKKTVTVYAPADGVEITHPTTAPAGGTVTETEVNGEKTYTWDGKIQKNAAWKISAALIPCSDDPGQDSEGNPLLNLSVGEEIKSCTWASTSLDILKVSGDGAECTITAVGAGTATISVSVTTVQGNVYTASVTVTVTGE